MDANIIDAACKRATAPGSTFTWGTDDCCTFVCDPIRDWKGHDLMARFRGKYFNESEAASAVIATGGFVETVQLCMRDAGCLPVNWPFSEADVGVVGGANGPMLALWTGEKWVARGTNGVVVLPARSGVLAWRMPDA